MANIILETARGIQPIAITDELLRNRVIFLEEEVTPTRVNSIIKQLMYLEKEDSEAEITIYINSPGGDVMSGLALYDCMSLITPPIRTVCIGSASSMAAILFLAGDTRQMLPHSKLMIHDPSFSKAEISGNKPHEIQQKLDTLNEIKHMLAKIIAFHTDKSVEEVEEETEEDTYYDAETAIKNGLADEILSKFRIN